MFAAIATALAYALAADSRVVIQGDSNIHEWSCEAKKVNPTIFADSATPDIPTGLFLYIPISGIDCGNGTMNDKLKDALHQGQHPAILFKLVTADRTAGTRVRITGELTINATTKSVSFDVDAKAQADGSIRATGVVPLKMTDFNVDPPGALFLHTKNEIAVKFDIHATQRPLAHASR